MSTHDAQANPLLTHKAIAAMVVALPLLTLPGTALALEDATVDAIVSEAIARTENTGEDTDVTIKEPSTSLQQAEAETPSLTSPQTPPQDEGVLSEEDSGQTEIRPNEDDVEWISNDSDKAEFTQSSGAEPSLATASEDCSADGQTTTVGARMVASAETNAGTGEAAAYIPERASIANGVYEIAPSYNSSRRLDVLGGSSASGANVQLYTSNLTAAQLWRFTKNKDESYTIINVGSGKALDVTSARAANGTNVQQYASNGTLAQHWFLEWTNAEHDSLVFRSALNQSYVLDIAGASSSNGANARIRSYDGNKGQSFNLVDTRSVANGVYVIANGSGKVLDVAGAGLGNSSNVQQYSSNSTMAQYFYLQYNTSTGYYTITNVQSGKVLDVTGARNANGTNVQQYTYNGTKAQQWLLRRRSNGTYGIYSAIGQRALDVSGGSQANSANVQIYASNNTKAQQWSFTSKGAVSAWLKRGSYQLLMANNTSNSLTIQGQSNGNSAQAVTGTAGTTGTYSTWQLVWSGDKVRLISIATGKALDVSGGSTSSGTKVQQYTWNGTNAQLWVPVMTSTGIKLQSALSSNIVLDVSGGSTSTGAKLQTYTSNNTYAQRFVFKTANLVESGNVYTLRVDMDGTGSADDYVIDVPGASTASGTAIQTYISNSSGAQQYLIYSENGGYRIQNINSGLFLTSVKGSSRVTQTSATDASTLWTFSFSDKTNSVSIVSPYTKLAITTASPSSAIITASAAKANGAGQGFFLTPYTGYVRGNEHGRLSGIDISSWNAGINLSKVACDFVIIKATQGTTYVNPYMKEQVASAIGAGKLIGFYHFADTSKGAANEARFFYNTVKPYIGQAVLVYDWENNDISHQNNLSRGPAYAKTFLDTVYNLSHVKPLIYMSRSVTTSYNWSSVANAGYELWVAQYLNQYYYTTVRSHVNNPTLANGGFGAWSKPAIYQYTSTGVLSGYSGKLDLNVFYGNRADWMLLASKR